MSRWQRVKERRNGSRDRFLLRDAGTDRGTDREGRIEEGVEETDQGTDREGRIERQIEGRIAG